MGSLRLGSKERAVSSLMSLASQAIKDSYSRYGSRPYKGSKAAFERYLQRRQAEDQQRRPGRLP